jgi:hypothetical protein
MCSHSDADCAFILCYAHNVGLRRLIQIKNKELRQMKSLAATILDQRTEVEQYFLESLQEVCALRFVCVKS